jgi:ribosomal-protein-alanine N-acetyltransferase
MSEDFFASFPKIELKDAILRELNVDDIKSFYNYLSDPEVNRFICDDDIPKTLHEAEIELNYWTDLFKNRRSVYWAIAKKSNNQLIGTCGFNVWSRTHRRVEISYDLVRKEWGKGLMTKVLRSVCDIAFIRMNVNRIQATVAHDNIGSIKVLTKLGFKQEGSLREYGVLHGVKKDFYMYSLLSNDLIF